MSTTITLHERHEKYLERHPELKLSGLVRNMLDERINKEGEEDKGK